MKVLCVGYRNWAISIYNNLKKTTNHKIKIISSKNDYSQKKIFEFNPELILFYGWSWKISKKIIDQFKCIMLHPSALPKFRGGSPIQNQIIRGVVSSKVTIFLMNDKIDAGDIIASQKLSLDGNIEQIFNRIAKIGIFLTKQFVLKKNFPLKKQNHKNATYYERLSPLDSEISIEELKKMNSLYLYNKIRMLSDPYPNAFIKTKDGKKLIIKKAEIK